MPSCHKGRDRRCCRRSRLYQVRALSGRSQVTMQPTCGPEAVINSRAPRFGISVEGGAKCPCVGGIRPWPRPVTPGLPVEVSTGLMATRSPRASYCPQPGVTSATRRAHVHDQTRSKLQSSPTREVTSKANGTDSLSAVNPGLHSKFDIVSTEKLKLIHRSMGRPWGPAAGKRSTCQLDTAD